MRFQKFLESLGALVSMAPILPLSTDSKIVVIGDLALGDGGSEDRAKLVADVLISALGMYYLDSGYTLVLAGDSEDLTRFWRRDVKSAWSRLHELLVEFSRRGHR